MASISLGIEVMTSIEIGDLISGLAYKLGELQSVLSSAPTTKESTWALVEVGGTPPHKMVVSRSDRDKMLDPNGHGLHTRWWILVDMAATQDGGSWSRDKMEDPSGHGPHTRWRFMG